MRKIKPHIVVYDESHTQLGITFPRRAKGLVDKAKARWLDATHRAIVLVSAPEEPWEAPVETAKHVPVPNQRKSFIKDAYRDDDEVVLRSSPYEIIKKSKSRTRMLHTASSIILWVSALLVFIVVNQWLGYTQFTLNPREMEGTWVIFVFAALFECGIEIFFCRKELAVLKEKIDLRQINPNQDGDMDLHGYKKRLTRKIRIMYSAFIWLPLALFFFIGGYATGSWMWAVFAIGFFAEVLMFYLRLRHTRR